MVDFLVVFIAKIVRPLCVPRAFFFIMMLPTKKKVKNKDEKKVHELLS
jgi:hypothetical protein